MGRRWTQKTRCGSWECLYEGFRIAMLLLLILTKSKPKSYAVNNPGKISTAHIPTATSKMHLEQIEIFIRHFPIRRCQLSLVNPCFHHRKIATASLPVQTLRHRAWVLKNGKVTVWSLVTVIEYNVHTGSTVALSGRFGAGFYPCKICW